MAELRKKRSFLEWFLRANLLKSRELMWILHFIGTHDTILEQVKIVEHVDKTPRGILVQVRDKDNEEAITLFKNQQKYTDVEQIFHEVRFHQGDKLYLEFTFPHSWQVESYLEVLEDNPFASWNDEVDEEVRHEMDNFFKEQEKESLLHELYVKIDEALENNDEKKFIELSKELQQLR